MIPIKNGTSTIIIFANRYTFQFISFAQRLRHLYNTFPRYKVVVFRSLKRKCRKIITNFFNRNSVKAHPTNRMISFIIFLVFSASCIHGPSKKTRNLVQELLGSKNCVVFTMQFEVHFGR